MNSNKLLYISSIIFSFVIFGVIYLLLTTPKPAEQPPSGDLKLHYNRQGITLYVPPGISSLEGFQIEAVNEETGREVYTLSIFANFAGLSLSNFPSPICLQWQSDNTSVNLDECDGITQIRQNTSDNLRFWIDDETGELRQLRILSGVRVVATCLPDEDCVFVFDASSASDSSSPETEYPQGACQGNDCFR